MASKRAHKAFIWIVIAAGLLFGIKQSFFAAPGESTSPLVINEFLSTNGSGLTDEDGDYSDWIEIYNRSNLPVNLAGWSLTDDPDQFEKWVFPDLTLGSHEYLVVFASGKDRRFPGPDVRLHTNFKLNGEGEEIALYDSDGTTQIDAITFEAQSADVSYGRSPDGADNWDSMATATPEAANGAHATTSN